MAETVRSLSEVHRCPFCTTILMDTSRGTTTYQDEGQTVIREIIEMYCPSCNDVIDTISKEVR